MQSFILDPSIVGFNWSDIHLFLRLIVAGILTITTFNLANRIYDAVYADTVLRRMQIVFDRYQLVIWVVQSLGSLTARSLKEDSFGFVQNDIDGILNCLLRRLADVETYVQDPPMAYKKLLNQKVIPREVEAIILALKEAINQISTPYV
ncbi:nucleoporin protein Ndc1-Nup-domain-containing protein [Helicostylum pulchrum]|nr:nucleoporin protein Ndc1-Nup-domain-containing protein [Helicostylum pulchrum]